MLKILYGCFLCDQHIPDRCAKVGIVCVGGFLCSYKEVRYGKVR